MNGNARPYLNPYLAGALLGTVLFLSFFITGGGLGASAGLNRVQVAVLDFFAPAHVDRVGYMAEMGGGSRNALNNSTVFLLLGSVLGGALSGWLNGRFKLEIRKGPHISNGTRLALGFYRRFYHGLRRPPGPGLHLRTGLERRRRARGRQLGLHVCRFRRGLRVSLFSAPSLELTRWLTALISIDSCRLTYNEGFS